MSLTDALVTSIRTCGYTDAYWERKLRIPAATIRRARIGETYTHVQTAPDTTPRDATGCTHAIRAGQPQPALPRKQRREWGL